MEELLLSADAPMEIVWLRHEEMLENLEDYGDELFETILNAAAENEKIGLFVARSVFEEE